MIHKKSGLAAAFFCSIRPRSSHLLTMAVRASALQESATAAQEAYLFRNRTPPFIVFIISATLFFGLIAAGAAYRYYHDGKVPDISLNYLGAADRLLAEGKFDAALAQYRVVAHIAPDDHQTWLRLGVAAQASGHVDEAIAAFSMVLRLDPKHAVAHRMLGSLYLQSNRLEKAILHNRAAIALQPRMAEAHSNLGTALLRAGQKDAAIASYRKALKINPGLAPTRRSLESIELSPETP